MGTIMPKTCGNCGRQFFTRDRNKIYCDVKCEDYARDGLKVEYTETERETVDTEYKKTCPNCYREFTKRARESYSGFFKRRCCCSTCGQQYRVKMEKRNK